MVDCMHMDGVCLVVELAWEWSVTNTATLSSIVYQWMVSAQSLVKGVPKEEKSVGEIIQNSISLYI